MFRLASAEWFAAWHVIRRREAGIIRGIGLAFMERIRRFRGWMRPSASVRLSLFWIPRSDTRAWSRAIIRSIVIEFRNTGVAILLQARKKFGVSVTQAPVVTLAKEVRNAQALY